MNAVVGGDRVSAATGGSMKSLTRVLLVEDNPGDARLLGELLREADAIAFKVIHVTSLAQALETVRESTIDVMLLDLSLPDGSGLDTVRRASEEATEVPIIVMTGTDDTTLAMTAVQEGVQDYLIKGEVSSDWLVRCIRYAIERKRARQVLARKNIELERKNANLQQLTYAMTHDLQTPLASLVGVVDILRSRIAASVDEYVLGWLSRIESSTLRMTEMLDNLNTYSKAGMDQLRCEPLGLASVVAAVQEDTRALAVECGVELVVDLDDSMILADREASHRVLANLVTNAVKHMAEGTEGRVRISCANQGDAVQVRIEDNGPGIAPERLDEMFIAFKRGPSKAPGTGLGLAIVARHVERLGGRVWLESDGRSGTCAVVEFRKPVPAEVEQCV